MTDQPLVQAHFDHVDGEGRLVFAAGEQRFAVPVDDTLERAMLEAKQITSEMTPRQPQPQTLPISQIQSLIRAGADPARVAERYGLSEALVRRFSSAVETEKQYAIEQFLSVPAPKESRAHTLSDLIDRTLAAARIRPDAVVWRATRRGLEPWKITAQFMSAGRAVRAEWSWNMHDNAVVCLNRTAGKLIGGRPADVPPPDDPEADDGFAAPLNLPGDSTRSALIEQTMSSWNTAENAPAPAVQDSGAADAPESPDSAQSQDAPAAEPAQPVPTAADQSPTVKPKRRSGRSAVPSWDEILFGD